MCNNLQKIISFYADCENKLFDNDLHYGEGNAEITCQCCTDCCSPGPQGECTRRESFNLNKMSVSVTPTSPQVDQTTTVIRNIVLSEFGSSSLFEDEDSAYSKALAWIISDTYTREAAEKVIGELSSNNNLAVASEVSNHHAQTIKIRFTLSLFYSTMSGNQWINCSGLFDFDLYTEENNCSYMNREGDIISGKARWLSPSHVCDWAGLTCDSSEGDVIKLEMSKCVFTFHITCNFSLLIYDGVYLIPPS